MMVNTDQSCLLMAMRCGWSMVYNYPCLMTGWRRSQLINPAAGVSSGLYPTLYCKQWRIIFNIPMCLTQKIDQMFLSQNISMVWWHSTNHPPVKCITPRGPLPVPSVRLLLSWEPWQWETTSNRSIGLLNLGWKINALFNHQLCRDNGLQ